MTQNSLNNKSTVFDAGNIHFENNDVTSTNTNGNINLTPDGTGAVQISGAYTLPTADGTMNQVMTTNGAGVASWADNSSDERYPITPYTVGVMGEAAYQTVQAALDAANLAGGGVVYVQPGTYTEDLTLYDAIVLWGSSEQTTFITGTHTPPSSGNLNVFRFTFNSATDVFNSTDAGTTTIIVEDTTFNVTNGFAFNLPNWTGEIQCFDLGCTGTNDGFITNSGGASVILFAAAIGIGTSNIMQVSGDCLFGQLLNVGCPVEFLSGAAVVSSDSYYEQTVVCSADSTFESNYEVFSTGANVALTYSSSANSSLNNATITTSNTPAISGSGAGTLNLNTITFTGDNTVAGTLTLAGQRTKVGSLEVINAFTLPSVDGTNGQTLVTNGSGVVNWSSAGTGTTLAIQTFTSSGTYTPTAGMEYCIVECIGGGGGSGGSVQPGTASHVSCGGAGGGGEYARSVVSAATVGASQTVTIGSGGAAGTIAGGNGGNGTATSLGTIVIANGGSGGIGTTVSVATGTNALGGAGGTGGTGDVLIDGGDGGDSLVHTGGTGQLLQLVGSGGCTVYSMDVNPHFAYSPTATVAAVVGRIYGGGASGTSTSNSAGVGQAGEVGADGYVIITEFI